MKNMLLEDKKEKKMVVTKEKIQYMKKIHIIENSCHEL